MKVPLFAESIQAINQLPGIPGVPFRNTARLLKGFNSSVQVKQSVVSDYVARQGSHTDQVACFCQMLSGAYVPPGVLSNVPCSPKPGATSEDP